MGVTTWTPEMDAVIVRGVAEKWPGSKIAERLGFTKGQVSGRARRLGLSLTGRKEGRPQKVRVPRPPAPPRLPPPPRARKVKPPAPVAATPAPTIPDVPRLTLMELGPDQCRWPIGDRYCSGEVKKRPYCDHHRLVSRGG